MEEADVCLFALLFHLVLEVVFYCFNFCIYCLLNSNSNKHIAKLCLTKEYFKKLLFWKWRIKLLSTKERYLYAFALKILYLYIFMTCWNINAFMYIYVYVHNTHIYTYAYIYNICVRHIFVILQVIKELFQIFLCKILCLT